jgi:hypothetical protein
MKLPKTRAFQVVAAVVLVAAFAAVIAIMLWRVPHTLVMATGPAGSAYAQYAEQYRQLLARSGVEVKLRPTGGTVENLRLLNDPAAGVDVAFLSAGTTSADKSPDLRTLGTVFAGGALVLLPRIRSAGKGLDALRGMRISIGTEGSASRAAAQTILQAQSVRHFLCRLHWSVTAGCSGRLRRGDIRPRSSTSADLPIVRELLADPTISTRFVSRAAAARRPVPIPVRLTVQKVSATGIESPPE